MKDFIDSIFARLTEFAPSFKFKAIYNRQYENIESDEGEVGFLFEMPAVFIELDLSSIKQLGVGYQIIEPLTVTLHIVMQQLDTADGTLDQNIDIFALKNETLLALQRFRPYQGSEMIRTSELMNYGHKNMYVYKQTFVTTYVDNVPKDIIRGIDATLPPIDFINTIDVLADYITTESGINIKTEDNTNLKTE